jgi:parallel beta-helix repeat protein
MKEKIFSYGTLVILLVGVLLPSNITATNTPPEEPELDYQWINDIVGNLSEIVYNITTNDIHMGRYFGSNGEQEAAYRIRSWMENNSRNLSGTTVYLDRVGNNSAIGDYYKILDRSNNKIDIHDYGLILKNSTLTIRIPNTEIFPKPKMVWSETEVEVTSDGFRDIEIINLSEVTNELSACEMDISYVLFDNQDALYQSFVGEVVQIEDYSSATENETANKVHFLEFLTNESEDTYYSKIEQAKNSNALGFVIVTTNPSYIKNLSISAFGIAISTEDGAKIKNQLNNDKSVILSFTEDNPISTSGMFQIYSIPQCIGEKKIGLIQDVSDMSSDEITKLSILCDALPSISNWVGFILCNTSSTLNTTHFFLSPSIQPYKLVNILQNSYSTFHQRPAFFVNDTIHLDERNTTSLWNWTENDVNLQARFWINESLNDSAISYNVFCEVPGKDADKYILISGGHHDYFWGEGTTDNAVGTATMLGILRYLNESGITPECNLIFASWAGEEVIMKGSGSYVFDESNDNKNRNITYMINLDQFAFNSANSTLEILASTDSLRNTTFNITTRTKYKEIFQNTTGYLLEHRKKIKFDADDQPFYTRFLDCTLLNPYRPEVPTDLQIITVNKPITEEDFQLPRHRAGKNFTWGDSRSILDTDDLNITAEMVLNITKYLVLEPPENEFVNCSFTPFDLCGDDWNDSVNISFNVTTNLTSWATIKAYLYNTSTGENVSDVNVTSFTIYKGMNTSGYLSVTLYPNMTYGTSNVSIQIYDDRMNFDGECHQLVNLCPYGKPIARFNYSFGYNRNVDFTDQSMASPGADVDEWYWYFSDGYHSHDQNVSHQFSESTDYTVTLTVWDTNNFSDSCTETLTITNSLPSSIFTVDANAVCVGKDVNFMSTSTDEDGYIESFLWDFGDGMYSCDENTVHSYSTSGVYTVTLTTTDDDGATNTTTKTDYLVIADALVDDDYLKDEPELHKWDTIQEGIDDVGDDCIVYVFNGSYDPIEIEKQVALYGEYREGVLINGGDSGVKIQCYNVTLNGFSINDGTCGVNITKCDQGNIKIERCNIINNSDVGILLDSANNCSVVNCNISWSDIGVKIINNSKYNMIKQCNLSEGYYGVYVSESSHNWIGSPNISNPYPTDCIFTYNAYAIYLDQADNNFILGCNIDGKPHGDSETIGIYLDNSENNIISTCKIYSTTNWGIYLTGSSGNKIEHCKISENPYGIYLSGPSSSDNLIVQNSINDNSQYGIRIPLNTQNNRIYYNDFINNRNGFPSQSYDSNSRGEANLWSKAGNNTLTKDGLGEGNYWDDYTGEDENKDGIGDTPYKLDPQNDPMEDEYPVMVAYEWCNDWE